MNALVTGISGFAGSHLADYLLKHTDASISGIVQTARHNFAPQRIQLYQGDLTQQGFVQETIAATQPDCIFHLAAQAAVGVAWHDPAPTYRTNILGQLAVLEAVMHLNLRPRILVISTAEVYGAIQPQELPVNEATPLRPNNPYAVSKTTQDLMGYQYWAAHRLPIIRVRPFNHIGPRQRDDFAIASFARQIAEIEAGLRPPVVRVGNLEARRDFTDVRDMVAAYWLAASQGEPGAVYNLGSGVARRIRDLLDMLLSMSRVPITIEQDPARMRPSDTPESRCDPGRFASQTGWQPRIPFEQTRRDVLDYWRATTMMQ